MTLREEEATGDCFVVAANTVSLYGKSGLAFCSGSRLLCVTLSHLDIPEDEIVLVHAVVTRRTDGRRHTHAWVEWKDKYLVFDYSNGTQVVTPQHLYYRVGEVSNIHTYSQEETRQMMVDSAHYGPWAEELEL